jgi:hypothetical protein
MQTRHSNMLAMAHFLKTRAEPVLVSTVFLCIYSIHKLIHLMQYYKPWQSRPGDESLIQQQIEEAKATIAREVAEFEARYPPEAFAPEQPTLAEPQPQTDKEKTQEPEATTQSNGQQVPPPAPEPEVTPTDTGSKETAEGAPDMVGVDANDQNPMPPATDEPTNAEEGATQDQTDTHRDDDGGEVLEDNEDTVIY